MAIELTGSWEDLIQRPEFRGHQVRITVVDQSPGQSPENDWLERLRELATNGVKIAQPADDSREGIYEAHG